MSDAQSTVEYRDIQDFPGYRIGSDGSVWSRRSLNGLGPLKTTWRRMKQTPRTKGHLGVSLCCGGGKRHSVMVHRLVLEAFVGPCPPGMECRHFPDRDPTNNNLTNLAWGTYQQNVLDKRFHGTMRRGEKHPHSKLKNEDVRKIRTLLSQKTTLRAVATMFGISVGNVHRIANGGWEHIK